MAKPVLENEKIKRTYATFLREAEGKDVKTVDRALSSICEFEDSTGGKPFKDFNIDQAIKFKDYLRTRKSKRSGNRLSYSSVDVTLRMTRDFFKLACPHRVVRLDC